MSDDHSESTHDVGSAVSQRSKSRPETSHVIVDGRRWPLELHCGIWRIRSRAKGRSVTKTLETSNLALAKQTAKAWLETGFAYKLSRKGGGTLEALAEAYLEMPLRTNARAAKNNVSRLRVVVRTVFGKELKAVTCGEVGPKLWEEFFRIRLATFGRTLDYATRRAENIRLNAAVRAARCLFLPRLLPAYAAAGFGVPSHAGQVILLPEPWLPRPEADDAALLTAWPAWREANPDLWLAVGLARFAGLRRDEIWRCRRTWIEEKDGAVFVSLRDRPEEGWQTKTGRPYRSLVLHPDLAAFLTAAPETVFFPDATDKWWAKHVCPWLKPFTGTANKPLHRLRGLYADQLARETEEAIIAKRAGLKAAQEALGHTSSRTTEKHYTSID